MARLRPSEHKSSSPEAGSVHTIHRSARSSQPNPTTASRGRSVLLAPDGTDEWRQLGSVLLLARIPEQASFDMCVLDGANRQQGVHRECWSENHNTFEGRGAEERELHLGRRRSYLAHWCLKIRALRRMTADGFFVKLASTNNLKLD